MKAPACILLDAKRGRWEFPELKRIAHEQYKYWEPETVIIEAKAAPVELTAAHDNYPSFLITRTLTTWTVEARHHERNENETCDGQRDMVSSNTRYNTEHMPHAARLRQDSTRDFITRPGCCGT